MINLIESNMNFEFPEDIKVIKLDDTTFYREHFMKLPSSKSIDFLIEDNNNFLLIEVKNFKLALKNKDTKNRFQTGNKDSLSLEVAMKVRDSISCILGATRTSQENEISSYKNILKHNINLKVILLLIPPPFYTERENIAIKMALQVDLKKKLKWLNAKIHILDDNDFMKMKPAIKITNTAI
ncbi:DUF6661 family protein [Lysinibacillus sp. FSL H8-0500]|uniref:DUF6661 family protein n=1 Tax=Lysinibacillus sp. FSL H8-0500 TaxID=2921393 RepID=UPI0031017B92